MRERNDFVMVRLTAAGQAASGGGPVRVTTVHMNYAFEGETPVEVQRAGEWPVLKVEVDAAGEPMFELVAVDPALTRTADQAPAAKAPSSAIQSPAPVEGVANAEEPHA